MGDFAGSPRADFDGRTFGFDGYAFYEQGSKTVTFGPALGVSYLDARVDFHGETGGHVTDLRIGRDDAQSLTGSFQRFPSSAPISLRSASPDRDCMELAAGLAVSVGEWSRLCLCYETTLPWRDRTENQVTAGLPFRF